VTQVFIGITKIYTYLEISNFSYLLAPEMKLTFIVNHFLLLVSLISELPHAASKL